MKKILSCFLILAALASLSVPAFAAKGSECVEAKVTIAYGRSTVTMKLYALEDTTNGQLSVTYDTSALTLASVDLEGEVAVADGETEGVVELGYASVEPLEADSVLAVLEFTYDRGKLTSSVTELGVSVVSFNADEDVNETMFHTVRLILPVIDIVDDKEPADEPEDEPKDEPADEPAVEPEDGPVVDTTTTVNEDGSVTETTTTTQKTENEDGSVSETVTVVEKTENTDGSTVTSETVTETVTAEDGTTETVTTEKSTTELADGTTAVVTTAADGKAEAEVSLSETAAESGETVTLPVSGSAVESIVVSVPENTSVQVEVPVEDVTPGTVLVIVHEDGTEEVVKKTSLTEDGVVMTLTEGATLKVVDNSKSFDDVAGDYWGKNAIAFASSRELMKGDGNGIINPEGNMCRGDLAIMLHNLEGNPETEYGGAYSDINATTYYAEAAQWATDLGLMGGYGEAFGGLDSVTREQFALILWRYAGMPESEKSLDSFGDANGVSSYSVDAMRWAVENGIVKGVGDGSSLAPTGLATRAQVAEMLMRFMSI